MASDPIDLTVKVRYVQADSGEWRAEAIAIIDGVLCVGASRHRIMRYAISDCLEALADDIPKRANPKPVG